MKGSKADASSGGQGQGNQTGTVTGHSPCLHTGSNWGDVLVPWDPFCIAHILIAVPAVRDLSQGTMLLLPHVQPSSCWHAGL